MSKSTTVIIIYVLGLVIGALFLVALIFVEKNKEEN